ncbi:MAG: RNA methyltransferase [Nitrospirae bacterium]|nr:RNA methyltransferase [Nitrospirota bacterium]
MSQVISSTKNPRVSEVDRLRSRRGRDESGLMLIDGRREIRLAVEAKMPLRTIYQCIELFMAGDEDIVHGAEALGAEIVEVSLAVAEKMAYGNRAEGMLAVAPRPARGLELLPSGPSPLYVVLADIEKPGNIGAVFRAADGAGASGVILCGGTDIFSPNAVRASMGAFFTVPFAAASPKAAKDWLRRNGVKIFAATPHAEIDYTKADMTGPCAIVLGSEDKGLGPDWMSGADVRRVRIPMKGRADSLNVAVSAALFMYEALRQRDSG